MPKFATSSHVTIYGDIIDIDPLSDRMCMFLIKTLYINIEHCTIADHPGKRWLTACQRYNTISALPEIIYRNAEDLNEAVCLLIMEQNLNALRKRHATCPEDQLDKFCSALNIATAKGVFKFGDIPAYGTPSILSIMIPQITNLTLQLEANHHCYHSRDFNLTYTFSEKSSGGIGYYPVSTPDDFFVSLVEILRDNAIQGDVFDLLPKEILDALVQRDLIKLQVKYAFA